MSPDDAPSQQRIDGMLKKLEDRIDTLKRRYRRYFMGIDQRPPTAMRRQVVREVHEAEQTLITNTAQKFKLRSLVQKFNTNKTRWNRTMRQIEEGTYHRDQKRAQRRQKDREDRQEQRQQRQEAEEQRDDVVEIDPEEDFIEGLEQLSDDDLDEVFDQAMGGGGSSNNSPAAEQPSPEERTPREKERVKQKRLAEIQEKLGMDAAESPVASSGGANSSPSSGDLGRQEKLNQLRDKLDRDKRTKARKNRRAAQSGNQNRSTGSSNAAGGDDSTRRVYEKLVEAKRRCNESTDNLSYDSVKKSINRQKKQLKKKRNARDVDFDVVIKDGQAFLKPDVKE